MLGIGILFKFSVLTLELNIQEYNTSLPAWATKIFLVALISFIIIYSASLYNGFFKKAFAEVRLSTKQLNAAKIEAEETIAFLPIPIMVINTELDIVYINDKYKESFGDCLSEGITFKQWLNNLHESESENKLTFNSIKDELLNITNLNSRTAVYSVGIKCVKDSVKFVELSAKKVNERFILSMVDVTERINYQNKLIVKERILQEQNEQLQSYTEELRQQNEEFLSMNEELSESYEHIQKMNVDLQEAKEKAEESDRLKSAFLSNMSHEIRTPMNGIIGFADLLIEADLEEDERKNYTSIISGSSKQLLNIVNDIIDFSKIEAGAIEIFNSKIDIYESLSDLQLFFAPMANEKGIELILGANLCSTDCRFVTDHTKLKQVLTNLLSNAIKFTKSGFVKFGVERVKDQMWFYVEDSGIGISTGKLGLVFERFRKVNEDSPGTGLGLAISKSYIEVLGGEIDVESEIGKGTRFSFNIPIKDIAEQKIY
jgi:signal transduction histidine kinase